MKKVLKIVFITLVALIVMVVITISFALWFVFTPEKLTPVIQKQAGRFITCQLGIEQVELTFFSTFPHFGLRVSGLELINPVLGAPSDTLLRADELVATIDASAWWKDKDLILNDFYLENVVVNAFTDSEGHSNFNVFSLPGADVKKDTAAFSLNDLFHSARLSKVVLNNARLSYTDDRQRVKAYAGNFTGELTAYLSGNDAEGKLNVDIPDLTLEYKGQSYLNGAALNLNVPINASLSDQSLTLHKASLGLNGLTVILDGTVGSDTVNGNMGTNLTFSLDKWQIKKVFTLVPPELLSLFKGIDVDGVFTLTGSVTGIYNKERMPLLKACLELIDGKIQYPGVPLTLRDVACNVDLQSDLQTDSLSFIRINSFQAKTSRSKATVTGRIDKLLSDMQCDLNLDVNASLSELQSVVPNNIKIKMKGVADGKIHTKFSMSQLEKMAFAQMRINGEIGLKDVNVDYDTLSVNLDKALVSFSIPNNFFNRNRENDFLQMTLLSDNLGIRQGKGIAGNMRGANLEVESSDFLNKKTVSSIHCNFGFDALNAFTDGNDSVNFIRPLGTLGIRANLNDKVSIPTLSCSFSMDGLSAIMDTIAIHVKKPGGKITLKADERSLQPEIKLDYRNESLYAKMGKQKVETKVMAVSADVIRDNTQKNALLQWMPSGFASLEDGIISIPQLSAGISVPVINFVFTPEKYTIKDSRIVIGTSDFQLLGELGNVSSYVRGDSLLSGNFKFRSNITDIASLMNLTSGIGYKEEVKVEPVSSSNISSGPFMVPKGMNISLETDIGTAFFKNDTARNIKGNVILSDGVLVLENMNFNTTAAKMQLTAMYKTPRKNHLFVGLDYHMTDVEISELLAMIPDIDSIMPMLRSFSGKGEFHMAVETNMDSLYRLKKSTLLGSASVNGENLVLMDGETFGEIAKMLRFNKKTRNKVDSLSAEFTIFKEEIDVYPFLIVMDKYKAVVGGRHNLDMSFDYHISLIDSPLPIRLGLDVSGTLEKMKYRLAKCRYSRLYRPVSRKSVDTSRLQLKELIRNSLLRRVKE